MLRRYLHVADPASLTIPHYMGLLKRLNRILSDEFGGTDHRARAEALAEEQEDV